ncbi:MAG: hypothetical protein R3Y53_02815 [Bacillota bacterium]
MMQWGLALVSFGGVLVMMSQLPPERTDLIVTGISLMIVGGIVYRKGKK